MPIRIAQAVVAWLLICGTTEVFCDAPQDSPKGGFRQVSCSIRFLRGDPAGSVAAGTVKSIGGSGSGSLQVATGGLSGGTSYNGQWYDVRLIVASVTGSRLKAKIAFDRGTPRKVNGENVLEVAESLQLNETYRLGEVIKLPSYKDPKGEEVWAEIVFDLPKPSRPLPAR